MRALAGALDSERVGTARFVVYLEPERPIATATRFEVEFMLIPCECAVELTGRCQSPTVAVVRGGLVPGPTTRLVFFTRTHDANRHERRAKLRAATECFEFEVARFGRCSRRTSFTFSFDCPLDQISGCRFGSIAHLAYQWNACSQIVPRAPRVGIVSIEDRSAKKPFSVVWS
jgi:hypothetical protein